MTLLSSIMVLAGLLLPALALALALRKSDTTSSELARSIAFGVIAIFASLYPYWAFGQYSAIGWYDEHDAIIPNYILQLTSTPSDFLHGFVGGTRSMEAFPDIGLAFVDLYALLLNHLGGPLASLSYRLFGLTILYCGIFVTARRIEVDPPGETVWRPG